MGIIAGAGDCASSPRGYAVPFSASNLIQVPLSALLEYSGILRPDADQPEGERLVVGGFPLAELGSARVEGSSASAVGDGEVSIRIVGAGDQEILRVPSSQIQPSAVDLGGVGDPGCGVAGASDDLISYFVRGAGR